MPTKTSKQPGCKPPRITRRDLFRCAALAPALAARAQTGSAVRSQTTAPDGFRAYTDAPRLFLLPARLKLLRRERERRSLRWEQFETLWNAGAEFPEFGWTAALRYQMEVAQSLSALKATGATVPKVQAAHLSEIVAAIEELQTTIDALDSAVDEHPMRPIFPLDHGCAAIQLNWSSASESGAPRMS